MNFTANIPFTTTLLILASFSNSLVNTTILDALGKSSYRSFSSNWIWRFCFTRQELTWECVTQAIPRLEINLLYTGYTISATAEDYKENNECCCWHPFGNFVSSHHATFDCCKFLILALSIPISGPFDIHINPLIGCIEASLRDLLGGAGTQFCLRQLSYWILTVQVRQDHCWCHTNNCSWNPCWGCSLQCGWGHFRFHYWFDWGPAQLCHAHAQEWWVYPIFTFICQYLYTLPQHPLQEYLSPHSAM